MASLIAGQVVIAALSLSYPPLVVSLVDWHRRCTVAGVSATVATATVVLLLMFATCLNVALGLASAAGQLVTQGDGDLGFGLHAAAFVLAAPATGLGVGGCVGLVLAARHGLRPAGLRWPAMAAPAANLGPLGGLFTLSGPFNSGNGILAGIMLPLGTLCLYVLAASLAWLRPTSSDDAE